MVTYSEGKRYVFSCFNDSDIFNPATHFNDALRPNGDYAEILIRPCSSEAYYEFHITPQNINSQYLFRYAYEIDDLLKAYPDKSATELLACAGYFFKAETHLDEPGNSWCSLTVIDLPLLMKNREICPHYYLNLCRRNCFRNSDAQQHSSILTLSELNYHHQNEWVKLMIP
ncbi:MAG: hypothetical protein JKX85_00495 [Phycisphaeraceae bacterium]|nr:hypothetical protein [Phycisphaeraceae bacterium]